jgi:hypothetical protein
MKYLISTSDTKYFQWQLIVQHHNFLKNNIHKDMILVYSFDQKSSKEFERLCRALRIKAYGYLDDRKEWGYTPSKRSYILSKLFNDLPELENETIFFTDPDVLFNKKPDFSKFDDDDIWYLSDTRSYLDSKYIKSKSEELFIKMCEIADIDPQLVIDNDNNAGGAQYIMKNLNAEYWLEVAHVAEKLYKFMKSTESKYNPEHPIQSWTADMWALIWVAWKMGYQTKIPKEMNFSWATDSIDKVESEGIYHNAGVFDQKDLFHKGHYSGKYPFGDDLSFVNDKKGSIYYAREIADTSKKYKEILEYING